MELFEGGISLAESFSVAVDIFQALVDDYALGRQFPVASCVLGGVQWYEVIGHDAASTIYRAFVSQCLVSQGIGEMYAVGICQFTLVVAVDDVFCIGASVSLLIGFLYAASAGRIILGHGESYHASVCQFDGSLHQSFSKRAPAHHYTSVLVLYGTREYFCCRCAVFIHQYGHFPLGEESAARTAEFLIGNTSSPCIDYQVILLEEFAGDIGSCLQVSSSILLQVYYQVHHALLA